VYLRRQPRGPGLRQRSTTAWCCSLRAGVLAETNIVHFQRSRGMRCAANEKKKWRSSFSGVFSVAVNSGVSGSLLKGRTWCRLGPFCLGRSPGIIDDVRAGAIADAEQTVSTWRTDQILPLAGLTRRTHRPPSPNAAFSGLLRCVSSASGLSGACMRRFSLSTAAEDRLALFLLCLIVITHCSGGAAYRRRGSRSAGGDRARP
jgi:hypothetical protein